jgi:hypothetical protein
MRFAASAAEKPTSSALQDSANRLHEAVFGADVTARIATEVGTSVDKVVFQEQLRKELEKADIEELDVLLLGETLAADEGRQKITATTSEGPSGAPAVRTVSMVVPNANDISKLLADRREENFRIEKPEALLEVLEKYYQEKCLAKGADHVAQLAAWGTKGMEDAEAEFGEVAAVIAQHLAAYRAALACGGHVETENKDFQFEVSRTGDGGDCLVIPPETSPFVALKDAVHMLLLGYRVLMVVPPRSFFQFRSMQTDLAECGLPQGVFDVVPCNVCNEDSVLLSEALRTVKRLQFTGSSETFKALVAKALELGNLRIEYGGEVSGLNQVGATQPLGHCAVAPSIESAIELGLKDSSSCIYAAAGSEGSATVPVFGTTGCKHPESAFGGMKTYTKTVAGDQNGVGSIQSLLSAVKRRGSSWRDQEEVRAKYELTEVAEMLTEFLSPRDQTTIPQEISNVLEVFAAFQPEVATYKSVDEKSELVTLKALKSTQKNLLIPKGVGLPEEIIKVALLCEMSPLKELPINLHLMDEKRSGKLRITDPLKSFLRVVERQLGWKVHFHADEAEMASWISSSESPPYFFCVKDRHLLPLPVLQAVAGQCGYFYEGLPDDALGLFCMLTTTQAWTIACTEAEVEKAKAALQKAWSNNGLREEPHEAPELIKPSRRDMDIGGGFNAGLDPEDDKDWAELSSDSSSSSSSDEDEGNAVEVDTGKPHAEMESDNSASKEEVVPPTAESKAEK